ncbi:MAG: hypothetical protein HQK67_09795, partial [Desulfamplus sp.]|nr:hypothetical protein [Desulfamplus sp.]
ELLRVQRGEEARKEKLKHQYKMALQELEQERKAKEEERKAKEAEKKAKEAERKAKEEALQRNEEIQRISVLSLKKAGYSGEEISKMLNIPLTTIESIISI